MCNASQAWKWRAPGCHGKILGAHLYTLQHGSFLVFEINVFIFQHLHDFVDKVVALYPAIEIPL